MLPKIKDIDPICFFEKKKTLLWQAPIICQAITKTFSLIPKFSKIIEVGCDLGGTIALLRKQGYLAWGIDWGSQPLSFYEDKHVLLFDFRNNLQFDLFDQVIAPKNPLCSLAFSLGANEPINKKYSDNYLDNLCRISETILISAPSDNCESNQVNWENKDWWTDKMLYRRYQHCSSLETQFAAYLRCLSNRSEILNLAEKIMIFKAIRFTGRNF